MTNSVNPTRIRALNSSVQLHNTGPVVYWMYRDQRVEDNWALIYAQQRALAFKQPLRVVICMRPDLDKHAGTLRMFDFMIKGLALVEDQLKSKQIGFEFLFGDPAESLPAYLRKLKASQLITDMIPVRAVKRWKNQLIQTLDIPFYEVDAHNVVPVWIASDKQEFAAYTIRPKIHRLLADYVEEFPSIKKHAYPDITKPTDWKKVRQKIKIDESVKPTAFIPGAKAAHEMLDSFINERLNGYATRRNDPNADALSLLSPYFHFGHLAPARAALEIHKLPGSTEDMQVFVEEAIVRRELADNFCFYSEDYDKFNGFHDWAQRTLNAHRDDKREYLYSLEQFEKGQTHDTAWNAAQLEMVKKGKMHGYMRMYWAKKMLEWTGSPEQAQEWAIYLNDKYELDGRDPNGYTGIAWSIGGVHDRAWFERPIFGKIRYMAISGLQRKFDLDGYIKMVRKLS